MDWVGTWMWMGWHSLPDSTCNQDPRSGYFARGTSHDEYALYSEAPEIWERVFNRMPGNLLRFTVIYQNL